MIWTRPCSLFLLAFAKTSQIDAFYIVGGNPAGDGEYPGFAGPTVTDASPNVCGATLVHEDMLLSAAHCSGAFGVGEVIFLGHNSIYGGDAEDTSVVEAIRIHPNYNDDILANDVMMIKLATPSNQELVPMAAAGGSDDPDAECPVKAIGYGKTDTNEPVSTILLEVEMEAYSFDDCNSIYGILDSSTQMCAGTTGGGQNICQGDSGGPLFNGAGVQVGVSSFTHIDGCAGPGIPAGFARVSGQRSFIDQAICEMSDSPPSSCSRRDLAEDQQQNERDNQGDPSFAPELFFGFCRRLFDRCP